jgi:hypothetical protein
LQRRPNLDVRAAVLNAIAANAERREEYWETEDQYGPAWLAAAKIKLLPEFIQLDDEQAVGLLESILGEDHWENSGLWGLDVDTRDLRSSFSRAWNEIIFPGGTVFAWPAVQADIVEFIPLKKHTKGYRRFLSFAAHLQSLLGSEPIYLPGRTVGEELGIYRETVDDYTKLAEREGILTLVAPRTGYRARRFTFNLHLFVKESETRCVQVKSGKQGAVVKLPILAISPAQCRQVDAASTENTASAMPPDGSEGSDGSEGLMVRGTDDASQSSALASQTTSNKAWDKRRQTLLAQAEEIRRRLSIQ